MAGKKGTGRAALKQAIEFLGSNARSVALFQALRMLDWAQTEPAAERRRIRIRHLPHMHPPNSDLDAVTDVDGQVELRAFVLGLLGPSGPMPSRLVEEALWQQRHDRTSPLGDFLAMLGERHVGWFYQAWTLGRTEELARHSAGSGIHRRAAAALSGAARSSRKHFGLLAHMMNAPRNASSLASMIQLLTRCPTQIEQFQSEWLRIDEGDRARLGQRRLGQDCTIGDRVLQRVSLFDICIQIPKFDQFVALIPGRGTTVAEIEGFVAQYIRVGMRWRYQLSLPASEARPVRLGKQGELGQTSWIGSPRGERAVVRFPSMGHKNQQSKGVQA